MAVGGRGRVLSSIGFFGSVEGVSVSAGVILSIAHMLANMLDLSSGFEAAFVSFTDKAVLVFSLRQLKVLEKESARLLDAL